MIEKEKSGHAYYDHGFRNALSFAGVVIGGSIGSILETVR